MGRLLIVSNRLATTVVKREGKLRFQASVGGLATGLSSIYKTYKGLWIGWSGISLEKLKDGEKEEIERKLTKENCYPVFLSQRNVGNYYYGFCNKTIWPLFHYFPLYTVYDTNLWRAYNLVNEAFCDKVIEIAKPDDIIWVHDYHLMLLPKLLRERLPNSSIGFFLHIPFPSFELFRLLPWRREIIEGLLGADLIGFHTYDYVRHFLDTTRRVSGYEHSFGQLTVGNRVVRVDTFPMGIDYEQFVKATHTSIVKRGSKRIRRNVGERKIILSIDRLDYTKGIVQRLEALEIFLDKNPEYKEKVILILVAAPSRTRVEQYKVLKRQVDETIGRINGKYGNISWVPVWYLYRSQPFYSLVALYNVADVALITPVRDGMNLIAKEFVASKTDGRGVLILSEMAGAVKELGESIIVNPNNKEDIADALKEALTMPEEEQIKRNRIMQQRLQRYDTARWANDFMDRLNYVKKLQQEFSSRRLTQKMKRDLIDNYSRSSSRLLLLDYDGTLIPFSEKPEDARPDRGLSRLLKALSTDPDNEVVIISGRDRKTLERWFRVTNGGLISEHGAWIKERGKGWETVGAFKNDWKEEVRPILELYVDRTPGSFIEEKDFSLVWHYRRVDPELSQVRRGELKDALLHLTANRNLGILEGSKVIEIKNMGINKGRAAMHWISKKNWDFILGVGDDLTDEDLFDALPESGYSIKVGYGASKAKFNVDSYKDVRRLLKEIGGMK